MWEWNEKDWREVLMPRCAVFGKWTEALYLPQKIYEMSFFNCYVKNVTTNGPCKFSFGFDPAHLIA